MIMWYRTKCSVLFITEICLRDLNKTLEEFDENRILKQKLGWLRVCTKLLSMVKDTI